MVSDLIGRLGVEQGNDFVVFFNVFGLKYLQECRYFVVFFIVEVDLGFVQFVLFFIWVVVVDGVQFFEKAKCSDCCCYFFGRRVVYDFNNYIVYWDVVVIFGVVFF